MGSLEDFQHLPYNPAGPLSSRPLWVTVVQWVKIFYNVLLFVTKVIPLGGYLLMRKFVCKKPKDIKGWIALVTGGANGLGRAISIELAKQGCHVVVADLDEYNALRTVLELRYYGVKAAAFKTDVACSDQVKELQRKIEAEMGPVDILVNNAGLVPFLVSDEYVPENLQRLMNVNILANFYTVNTFLPGMYVRRKGHIVTIVSATAFLPVGFIRHYTTTKYAMRGFMEELRDEIRHAGQTKFVKTTTIFPFFLNTRKEMVDAISKIPYFSKIPLVDPNEAAKTIVRAIRINKRKAFVPDWVPVSLLTFVNDIPRKIKYLFQDQFLGN
ncbi:estradiol 17-beta-dehydrogenase 11-like [Topomyia yanbarensis]|uniref:estradiol 17-beta-dehydrogenase 11-like n=1 Tax=Topomyia yanbarensis TaxID=2498891 RepID=UPI00273B19BF|nr:estradiol 17-beta-dehydrogenase 11-like [Topomyia yanbarensis]